MPHGAPDASQQLLQEWSFGVTDQAELASRLQSSVLWDRAGKVISLDNFAFGDSRWAVRSVPAGNQLYLAALSGPGSGYALCFDLATGTGNIVTASTGIRLQQTETAGVELAIRSYPRPSNFLVWLTVHTPAQTLDYRLDWQVATNDIRIFTGGAWVAVLYDFFQGGTVYDTHFLKATLDVVNQSWGWLRANFDEVNLAAYPATLGAPVGPYDMVVEVDVQGHASWDSLLYLQHVIVTRDEPR